MLWHKICLDLKMEVVHEVLYLAVALSYLRISGAAREGRGCSMFWLLITGIVVGLFANRIIKVAQGDGYLPDVEDEGEGCCGD